MIWFNRNVTIDILNQKYNTGLSKLLKMTFFELGEDFLTMKMSVGEEHWQPYGILHGGASVVAAETVGSCAANLVIDSNKFMAVGQEVNANHIRAFKSGELLIKGTPIHIGSRSHVWQMHISDAIDSKKLICISRLTMAVIEKRA